MGIWVLSSLHDVYFNIIGNINQIITFFMFMWFGYALMHNFICFFLNHLQSFHNFICFFFSVP